MLELWIERGWPAFLLWSAVFVGDYVLTLWGSRLYRSGASEILLLEDSHEITPAYPSDADAGRWLSRRFLPALAGSTAMLAGL